MTSGGELLVPQESRLARSIKTKAAHGLRGFRKCWRKELRRRRFYGRVRLRAELAAGGGLPGWRPCRFALGSARDGGGDVRSGACIRRRLCPVGGDALGRACAGGSVRAGSETWIARLRAV
jgi:hypothetical protein